MTSSFLGDLVGDFTRRDMGPPTVPLPNHFIMEGDTRWRVGSLEARGDEGLNNPPVAMAKSVLFMDGDACEMTV